MNNTRLEKLHMHWMTPPGWLLWIMVMDKHFMFSHIIYMCGSQPHFGLVLTETTKSRKKSLRRRDLWKCWGVGSWPQCWSSWSQGPLPHTTSLRSVGAAPTPTHQPWELFFNENWVLINGQGRGGWDRYIYVYGRPPKPMMVNNINMKGTMIQSLSSCHIRGVADLHMGGAMASICDTRAFDQWWQPLMT